MNVPQRIPLMVRFAADGTSSPSASIARIPTSPGIVYHANFLRYMERGRTNHLRLIAADHRALLEATEKEAPGFACMLSRFSEACHALATTDAIRRDDSSVC
jgi:hypothetical protein